MGGGGILFGFLDVQGRNTMLFYFDCLFWWPIDLFECIAPHNLWLLTEFALLSLMFMPVGETHICFSIVSSLS